MSKVCHVRILSLLLSLGVVACGTNDSATDSTSSSPLPTTTVVPAPITMSLAFAGDVLIHSQVWKAAAANKGGNGFDFTPMFARIKPLIESADLAICHLEVPLVARGEKPTTNPLYSAPTEIAAAIKNAGFDRCSTASNHTFDKGAKGIKATLDEFDSLGLGQSGMARTPDEIEPKIFSIKGINVAHLSYTYGFNGISAPNDEAWRSARIEPTRIIADAQKACDMGARVVIVSMHWGRETQTEISEFQKTNADAITKSGLINLVIGHHAHVVQKIDKVNDVWTIFGLSNLISYLPTTNAFSANTQDGIIATTNITLNPDGSVIVDKPGVHPIWVDKKNGVVVRPVIADLADPTTPKDVKDDLKASLNRTRSVVGDFIATAP